MNQTQREKVIEIMEGYSNNPSNRNKYYHQMLAVIEDDDYGLPELPLEEAMRELKRTLIEAAPSLAVTIAQILLGMIIMLIAILISTDLSLGDLMR